MYKTVHPKIAFVLGFLVHDMEFVEFDRNVLLVVDCITKKKNMTRMSIAERTQGVGMIRAGTSIRQVGRPFTV